MIEFWDILKARLDNEEDFVDIIALDLNLSKSAVYKRIKGVTNLTAAEMIMLAQKYQLNLNNLCDESEDNITFHWSGVGKGALEGFLYPAFKQIDTLSTNGTIQLTYASSEIPIMFIWSDSVLYDFKLLFWCNDRTGSSTPIRERRKLGQIYADSTQNAANSFLTFYNMENTFLLNRTLFENYLMQAKYGLKIGLIDDSEFELIIDRLRHLSKRLQDSCITGQYEDSRYEGTMPIKIYHNYSSYVDHVACLVANGKSLYFGANGSPDFLSTNNPIFCDHQVKWLHSLIYRSSLITNSNQVEQLKFFKEVNDTLSL